MSEVHAAIGIEQLKKLDSFLKIRKINNDHLTKRLQEISEISILKSTHGRFQSSYYCHTIILNDSLKSKRYEIVEILKRNGVGTSVYYPEPVPYFSYYKNKYGFKGNEFPVAEKISHRSIALPVGPHLNEEDMDYIAVNIKNAIKEVR